jgi:hypothetical protein
LAPQLTNIPPLQALIGLLTPLAYVIIVCVFIETTARDFNLFIKTNFSYRLAEFMGIFYLVLVIYSSFNLISFSGNWLYLHPPYQKVDYSVLSQMLKGKNRNWIGIDITYQSISLILKRLEDTFGKEILDLINLNGIPKDMESARALALKKDDRIRKEFEKWAILTYSNNRATINDKKGADKGIDGLAFFDGGKDKPEKIIIQVKSGKVKSGDIRDLQGTMTLNNATLGIFITLNEPTKEMLKTAKEAGIYQSKYMNNPVDKITIVTVREMIEEQKRLEIKLVLEVLKSAEKQQEIKTNQMTINF